MIYYHDNYYLYADRDKVALKPLVSTPKGNNSKFHIAHSVYVLSAGGKFQNQPTPQGQDFFIISETDVYIVLIFEEGKEAFVTPRTKVISNHYHFSLH